MSFFKDISLVSIILFFVRYSTGDNVLFNTISLNPSNSSITVPHNSDITKVEQVEKNTIFIVDSRILTAGRHNLLSMY